MQLHQRTYLFQEIPIILPLELAVVSVTPLESTKNLKMHLRSRTSPHVVFTSSSSLSWLIHKLLLYLINNNGTAGILCIINNTIFIAEVTGLCLFLHSKAVASLSRVVVVASADASYLSSGLLSSFSESELTALMYLSTHCSFSDWIL